ncbi:MAG: UvrD-helicase domain-containing protein [Solirubrobacteraceae bacterium]
MRSFSARYARAKRDRSGLDFEDLELLTRDLLLSGEELRERYAGRFEQIMVDELQDTNQVQLELIESIARGNLFTVGDAQQSIYAFRHADVELFQRRGQRLSESGARITLRTNFRSRTEILAAINTAFIAAAAPAGAGGRAAVGEGSADRRAVRGEGSMEGRAVLGEGFTPLLAGRTDLPAVDGPLVELLIADKGAAFAEEGLASPWRLGEARALARRVSELIDGGASPKDVVVLTRASTDLRAYESALERRGVPTYVIGGRGYWSHPQVLDMVAYLCALANPRDEQALYTVLSSPLVGVSLDALVLLAAAARAATRDPWWTAREPEGRLDELDGEDREKLSEFVDWFAPERSLAAREAIEELIDRALERTGYDLAMLAMPGGERRLANVRKLMRLAREHEASCGRDLTGFVELVRGRSAWRAGSVGLGEPRESRESEAPVEGEALDAVRLMTVHRAKGLEFEIVCVADLGRGPRRAADLLRIARDGRLGLRLAQPGTGKREPALDYVALGEERGQAEALEERRLFYVAMTRARERLILSGAAKLDPWGGGGPIAWIGPAFVPDIASRVASGETDAGVRFTFVGPDHGHDPRVRMRTGDDARPGEAAAIAAFAATPAPGRAPPVSRLSYSSLVDYERCGYRFYAERVLGLPRVPEHRGPGTAGGREPGIEPRTGAERGLTGAERGVIAHTLLEKLDFRRPARPTAAMVAATCEQAAPVGAPGVEECEELAELVERFAASEICARLGRATSIRCEQRFGFLLEPGGVLINGVLDVLATERDGRRLVVDYKSDRLYGVVPAGGADRRQGGNPAGVADRAYTIQRLVYALAVLRTGATGVEVVHVFLENPHRPVTLAFARGDAPELERALKGLVDGVLARRFAVAQAPHRTLCRGCPAEGGLCSWPLELTRRETPDRLF